MSGCETHITSSIKDQIIQVNKDVVRLALQPERQDRKSMHDGRTGFYFPSQAGKVSREKQKKKKLQTK